MDEKEMKLPVDRPAETPPEPEDREPEFADIEDYGCGNCCGCDADDNDMRNDTVPGESFGGCPCSSGGFGGSCEYVES
ncbi:MAG: hypothetical protein WC712_07165 [Candidatus Brocadiia bacterium]